MSKSWPYSSWNALEGGLASSSWNYFRQMRWNDFHKNFESSGHNSSDFQHPIYLQDPFTKKHLMTFGGDTHSTWTEDHFSRCFFDVGIREHCCCIGPLLSTWSSLCSVLAQKPLSTQDSYHLYLQYILILFYSTTCTNDPLYYISTLTQLTLFVFSLSVWISRAPLLQFMVCQNA